MSSSYSSLDWVLSHWAHFTVPRFFCVYVCVFVLSCHTAYVLYCNTVGLKPNPYDLPTVLWLGWVIWSVKTWPRYDLYVFGGMLNLTQSICTGIHCCLFFHCSYASLYSTVVRYLVNYDVIFRLQTKSSVMCTQPRNRFAVRFHFSDTLYLCLVSDIPVFTFDMGILSQKPNRHM